MIWISILSGRTQIGSFDNVISEFQLGNYSDAKNLLISYNTNIPDSLQVNYSYLMGVVEETIGHKIEAIAYLEKCIELAEERELFNDTYIDALARCINLASKAEDWTEVVRLTRKALTCPDTLLATYPNTYMFYEWQIHALNSLWKYQDVVTLADKGQALWEKKFLPTQKEFYNLRIGQVVALLLMNKWDEAERKISEIENINAIQGYGIVDYEVSSLRGQLTESKSTLDWRDNPNKKIKLAYEMANNLLLSSPSSAEGYYNWTKFFSYIQKQLELCYFDINDPEDERFWSQLLACAIVYFNTIYEDMPNHSEVAYNQILLRKNFLDYHSGLLHKTPKRWQEVRDNLKSDELAIEITMCPDEILILGSDYQVPIAIQIPDEILERLESYNKDDAVSINEFYAADSPLLSLIQLIIPYCQNINTIFLSPTNLFAQFNYSIIPFEDGIVEDRFHLIQLTTTADIEIYQANNSVVTADVAMLYGGIDYDNASIEEVGSSSLKYNKVAQSISNIRSGYGYLPYTLDEVMLISKLLPKSLLITGNNASETRFKDTDWNKLPSILHLATHGYSLTTAYDHNLSDSTSRIMSLRLKSGVLMSGANQTLKGIARNADDGILSSQEIADLDMSNVELAVLSSCSSGMGDLTNITGIVYGVSHAMKSAGVKHLVVALWDIPDEATSIGMKNFYENIVSGKSIHESIKLMRKHLINKGYTDPYYWGAFIALD